MMLLIHVLGAGKFIDKLATALGPNCTVSIDMITWDNPLWTDAVLNRPKLGRAIDMSTCETTKPASDQRFFAAAAALGDISARFLTISGCSPSISVALSIGLCRSADGNSKGDPEDHIVPTIRHQRGQHDTRIRLR